MFGASEDPLHALVLERGRRAIGDADLLVLVDGWPRRTGRRATSEIAKAIREAGKPALLAINKTDDRRARSGALEMYQLGFDPVFEIAAEHGDGVGDLLDAIVERLATRDGPALRLNPSRSRWRSSAVRTPASRRWSIGCSAKNA